MTTKSFYRMAGFFGLLSAAGLLVYWLGSLLILLSRGSIPLEALISGEAAASRLAVLSQHPWWRIINAGQVFSLLSGMLFMVTVMVSRREKLSAFAYLSGLTALAGLMVMAGISFSETILWPPAAMSDPGLLDVYFGPFYSDRFFWLSRIGGPAVFSAGSFLFGFLLLRKESWPGALLFSLGALLYGAGLWSGPFVWGIRTLGVLMYSIGLILLAVRLCKRKGLLISAE